MAEILVAIETYRVWIYLALAVLGVIYLRVTLGWLQDRRKARFGLEWERASTGLRRSIAMLVLIAMASLGTFLVANFVGPSLPFAARPSAAPTVSLLVSEEPSPAGGEAVGATEVPIGTIDGSGCHNPQATLTSPQFGETLSGVIDVEGTADIANFAFYKYEFRGSADSSGVWQAISAGTEPVVDGLLGTWDTGLVPTGDYAFRLVVTDTSGNAPMPCEIQVRVVPTE